MLKKGRKVNKFQEFQKYNKKLQQGKKFYINRGKRVNSFNRFNFCNFCIATFVTLVTIYTFVTSVVFAGIANTKHDLSTGGTGSIKATGASGVTQKCVFCHTPHSSTKEGPLWNHSLSGATSVCNPASDCSVTQKSLPGQPDKSSRLCLACHDGTVAVGLLVNMPGSGMGGTVEMAGVTAEGWMPSTATGYLGTNLRGKHLVSIVMDVPQFITDKKTQCNDIGTQGIQLPVSSSPVKLCETNNTYGGVGGKGIQCRTCHDPHDDSGNWRCFLVHVPGINCTACPCDSNAATNPTWNYDALCNTCHYGPPCP